MPEKTNAASILAVGDALVHRAQTEGRSVAEISAEAGLGQPGVRAAWLAGRYDLKARDVLGEHVFRQLSAGHLEAVATLPDNIRADLLRIAAHEQLPVRQLRAAAAARSASDPAPSTTIDELGRAARTMKTYSSFNDAALRQLADGPNGTAVRDAAAAGRELCARLEEFAV